MPLTNFPRNLTRYNIADAIAKYLAHVDEIPLQIFADSPLELLHALKRKLHQVGPYPHVTIFEGANRMMTDLIILYGVQYLLTDGYDEFQCDSYRIELGNEDNHDNDIYGVHGEVEVRGEAFNVASSFFQTKKSSALAKLRNASDGNDIILIMYNADAVTETYKPQIRKLNEVHIIVDLNTTTFRTFRKK
jgi:hypothetical protein